MQLTAPSRPTPARRLFALTLTLAMSLCLLAGTIPARAAATDRTLFPKSLKPLPEAKKAAALTSLAVSPAAVVEFQISLRMRNFAKLQARVSAGEHVSRQELQDLYFPLASDYQAVATWVKAQGLTVVDNDATHLGLRVRGQVAVVEQALATRFAHVSLEGKDYLAAQVLPSLPTRIAAPVLGINGLQPYTKARFQPLSPTIKDTVPYTPSDIMDAYSAKGLKTVDGTTTLDGAGQTIAILIDTVPNDSDLTTFWTNTNVPQKLGNITEINVNGVETLPAPEGEETLDVSWTSGIASAAKIRVYATGSLYFDDLDRGLQRMISDMDEGVVINELSVSLGLAEQEISPDEVATESQYYATLAARGVSIFISTGDTGSDPEEAGDLEASYPSTDPSVTAVGGTSLFVNENTAGTGGMLGKVREIVWNSIEGAGGGGESLFFQMPAYQSGNGIVGTADNVGGMRLVPDVCSAADPETGCYLFLNGKAAQYGGTSWSAPTWAGFAALINQAREAAGVPDLGLLNPSIYPLLGTGNFRDIVEGNNYIDYNGTFPDGVTRPFTAVTGYDEATGIGAPVVSSLVATLTNVAALAINSFSPQTGTPGTQVTIMGEGLDRATIVRFNGTSAADFTAVSGTELLATVPGGATTGPISVVDRAGTMAASAENFTVLPAEAGANDNFINAQVIGAGQTRLIGSNVGATKEAGEPNHAGNPGGASVWYRWTAPASDTYTFNTVGSSFDTLLAVYTGTDVADLTLVVSNDDFGTSTQSSVVFQATEGTTYSIAVDGALQGNGQAAQGTVVLNEAEDGSAPVINDFSPTTGAVGATVQIFGTNFFNVSNVQFNGTSAAFDVVSLTQITATVPAGATTGPITLVDTFGDRTSSSGFFTVVPKPTNDDFNAATPLVGAAPSRPGTNAGATKQAGEPDHADNAGGASVWFTWTAPASGVYTVNTDGSNFDTLLAIYTGDNVAALTPVASNDDAGPLGISSVTFNAVGGTVYHLAVDGFDGTTGNYRLNLQAASGTPAITSLNPATGGAGTSVAIIGTGFLTTSQVQFNGITAPGFQVNSDTQITVTAPTGVTTGNVTVTGLNGTATSPGVFTVLPTPGNDNFANAVVLVGAAPLNATGYTEGATKEAGEPEIVAADAGGHSVWYTWTPPAGGTYTITTRGSDFDTLLGIYTGTSVANLTPVAANDDDPAGGVTSAVTLTAVRGTTYHLVVDGANGDAGNLVLNILDATATLNLYSTAFEPGEGFSLKQPLVGQGGWVALNTDGTTATQSPGGNGVIDAVIPNEGQQAFVGNLPTTGGAGTIRVYHPISYPPPSGTYPVVNFSTTLRFANSTNGQHDRFAFSPIHSVVDGETGIATQTPYFTLLFDEATGGISYQLDDGNPAVPTGKTFGNDVTYALQIALNMPDETWSATLNGETIVSGLPISTLDDPDNLSGIAADWFVTNPATPGDNFMAFDNYVLSSPAAQAPAILVQPTDVTTTAGSTVSFSVVADGTPTLFYQWSFNGVAIVSATANQPTYTVDLVNSQSAGRYSVTVTNEYGTVQSLDAFLVVSTTQAANTEVVQNNPQVPQVTVSSGQAGSVLFTRTGDLSGTLTVSYTVSGSAQPGVDYQRLAGTVNIKAGRNRKRVKIVPIDRGIRDGSRVKVVIKVIGLNGYTVGSTPKQKVYIIQD